MIPRLPDDERGRRIARALREDGAAPVPEHLAARAYAHAIAHVEDEEPGLVSALVAVGRPFALAAAALAVVVTVAFGVARPAASDANDAALTLVSVDAFDADRVVGAHLFPEDAR